MQDAKIDDTVRCSRVDLGAYFGHPYLVPPLHLGPGSRPALEQSKLYRPEPDSSHPLPSRSLSSSGRDW